VNPAISSIVLANARKPSWSSTTRMAEETDTAPVSYRRAPLASGLALTRGQGQPRHGTGTTPMTPRPPRS
jgi:hypothetical protein